MKTNATLIVIVLFSAAAIIIIRQNSPTNDVRSKADLIESYIPSPSPVPKDENETASQTSSDGKLQLTLKTHSTAGTKTYSYVVAPTTDSSNNLAILTDTVDGDTVYTIPYNTFSTDNKYLFVEKSVKGMKHVLIFKTSGEPFAGREQSIDVRALFSAYTSDYAFSEVTGWASETLLIIRSVKADSTSGPSYWLNVSTRSFTRLSNRF